MRNFMTLTTVTAALALLAPAVAAPAPPQKATTEPEERVVLGKLGQVTKSVAIRTAPTSSSRTYYTAKVKEYLILQPSGKSGWHKILMQNGGYGYAPVDRVDSLPYEVTAKKNSKKSSGRSSYVASRGGDRARAEMAQFALQFQGTPYVWGGNDPLRGIDCSGFVKKMYGAIGLNLPRTAAEQALVGKPIYNLEDLQKGDRLYFWDAKRGKIGHTGIYMGDGTFVHSSSGRGGVATDRLDTQRWLKILVAARR